MKLSLLHKKVNTSSHRKGNLMVLNQRFISSIMTRVQEFKISPANYHYPGRDHETLFELSEFGVIRGRVNRVSLYVIQLIETR